ncbi:hypothetical protein GE09DRAFT_488982 [Coniochaeta sp. 2T2.1]|nr:hypothetical protein GE09DRAFT_488982 [Coniochaeta sp. 2T2.1]
MVACASPSAGPQFTAVAVHLHLEACRDMMIRSSSRCPGNFISASSSVPGRAGESLDGAHHQLLAPSFTRAGSQPGQVSSPLVLLPLGVNMAFERISRPPTPPPAHPIGINALVYKASNPGTTICGHAHKSMTLLDDCGVIPRVCCAGTSSQQGKAAIISRSGYGSTQRWQSLAARRNITGERQAVHAAALDGVIPSDLPRV